MCLVYYQITLEKVKLRQCRKKFFSLIQIIVSPLLRNEHLSPMSFHPPMCMLKLIQSTYWCLEIRSLGMEIIQIKSWEQSLHDDSNVFTRKHYRSPVFPITHTPQDNTARGQLSINWKSILMELSSDTI